MKSDTHEWSEEDSEYLRDALTHSQHGFKPFSISHYQVLGKIGAGGMGEVFVAADTHLRRKVALKILPKGLSDDRMRRQRFFQEARANAAIEHPNIAVVHDIDEADGQIFIAMELVRGSSLREMIREGKLSVDASLDIATQIASALARVHEHGIVHRDLKPDNVMVSKDGVVKVIDFGLAKLLEPLRPDTASMPSADNDTELATGEGRVVGTAAYMSPEQARSEPVDARSDIFSFGVVLYELVMGEAPFRRRNFADTLSAILRDAAPPVTLQQGKTPAELQAVVTKCLQKEPEHRYQTFPEVVEALQDVREHIGGKRPTPTLSWRVLVPAALLVALLLSGTYWLARRNVPVDEARQPVSVLIADFANQTGEPVFDGAIEQALSIGLEGAPFITSYGRPRARRQAGQLDADSAGQLDASLARLVCRSQGIKVAITGSIEPSGRGYSIRARAFDPVTGDTVSEAESSVASKAGVLSAADELASELRRDLGDVTTASAAAMSAETFTTTSVEAMNLYARAQELVSRGEYDDAKAEFERALEADPGFGRAYSGLATLYFNLGEGEASQESFEEAMAREDRMTEREKLRTRGGYFVLRGSYDAAVDELTRLVEQYPADFAGQNNLALAHFYRRDMENAAVYARRGLEIYPKNVVMRNNMALFAMYAGEFESAITEADTVLEENASFAKAYIAKALSQLATGQPDAARQSYEALLELGDRPRSMGIEGLADLALYQGRADDAIELLTPAVESDLSSDLGSGAARKLVMLAQAYLVTGDRDAAAAAAERALSLSTRTSTAVPVASVLLEVGREERALQIADELGARLQSEPQAYSKLIEGLAALGRSEYADAVRVLREASSLADVWLIRLALGRTYVAADAFPEAHAELELALERRGEATAVFLDDVPSYRYLPQVHYYLGRSEQGLGSAAATEAYQTFLDIKADGDDGDPMVEDARRRLQSP